jgi:phosphate starvation-inducible protein PhoH and related proteins
MTKQARQTGKRARRDQQFALPGDGLQVPAPRAQKAKRPLEARTDAQNAYINAIDVYDIIFGIGPLGTGKTYVAVSKAADELAAGRIDQLIVTRPAVNADEEYGFLPGDMLDDNGGKFAPYFAPVRAILERRLGAGHVEYLLKAGKIQIAPLGHLRGHTFENAWVLFDEAQNCTPKQMELFLGRMGERCKVIIDGDFVQKDITGKSGLEDALEVMEDHPQVGIVEFTLDDIVRSGLARDIAIRYHNRASKRGTAHEKIDIGLDSLRGIVSQSATNTRGFQPDRPH